jgi:hypothetical protein
MRAGAGAGARAVSYAGAVHLGLIAIAVSEYDPAASFFVDRLDHRRFPVSKLV